MGWIPGGAMLLVVASIIALILYVNHIAPVAARRVADPVGG